MITVEFLRKHSKAVTVSESEFTVCENIYFRTGLKGTSPAVYIREALLLKLVDAAKNLPPQTAFYIFDGFRSIDTQLELFNQIKAGVLKKTPHLSDEEAMLETKKYAAHPEDKARFPCPPHNTGGAIDIALCDRKSRKLLEFGGVFDDPTEKSATLFFENEFDPKYRLSAPQWLEARQNRKLLLSLLVDVGFTNYEHEWWHFDLGNWVWAAKSGLEAVYSSMEGDVKKLQVSLSAR